MKQTTKTLINCYGETITKPEDGRFEKGQQIETAELGKGEVIGIYRGIVMVKYASSKTVREYLPEVLKGQIN